MSFQLSQTTQTRLVQLGKIVLGVAVGASFGVVIGALVASWIWGVEAIEGEAVSSSYLAGATTLFGAVVGGGFGFRAGRRPGTTTDSDPAAPQR